MIKINKNLYIVDTFKQPKNSYDCPYYAFSYILTYIEQQNFNKNRKLFDKNINYLKNKYIKLGGNNIIDPCEELELLLKQNKIKFKNNKDFLDKYTTLTILSKNNIILNKIYNNNIILIKDYPNNHYFVIVFKDNNFYILDSIDNNHSLYNEIYHYLGNIIPTGNSII